MSADRLLQTATTETTSSGRPSDGARLDHARVRVDESSFGGGETVVDEERPGRDLPQRLTARKVREQFRLRVGQAQQLTGVIDLTRGLAVDHASFSVGQQAFGEADLMGAGGAPRPGPRVGA